jgi:hypothetical protein
MNKQANKQTKKTEANNQKKKKGKKRKIPDSGTIGFQS